MEFPGKICLLLLLVAYTASVSYGYPNSPPFTGTFSSQFPSVTNTFGNPQFPSSANTFGRAQAMSSANTFGRPQSMASANTFGRPRPMPSANTFGRSRSMSSANTFRRPQSPSTANSLGRPQSSLNADNIRSPLFPSVVQDFVENVFQNLLPFFTDFDSAAIRNLSADQLFSIFYDIVYKSTAQLGNPNPKFHSLCKAQSVKENYDKVDGKFLILVTAYTTGELLLQNEILKDGNQKRLADLFAKDFLEGIKSGPNDPESHIRSSHEGYVNFLISQGLATKTNAFAPPAVYVEVINALSKNYQIPFDPPAFNHVPFPNPSNFQIY